jgi:hypothetical protein
VNDTISNTHNSQKLNSNLTISSDNVKDNTINQELVIDCLVSLRNHTDVNGCLCPGNFEEGPDTFYGIIPLTITMIEEIYEVRAKMVVDLKDQRLVDDYGKRLKEIKKRMNDDLPILNVVKLNNIVDPEITKLLDEISDIEDKYNKLKDDYTQKYIKDNDEDNNNDLQLNLQKYI